jgi:hypothetical protein
MNRPEVESLVKWLLEQSSNIEYGKITLEITKHAGKIKFVEKTTSIKEMQNG